MIISGEGEVVISSGEGGDHNGNYKDAGDDND
jgi:hypothetical protein